LAISTISGPEQHPVSALIVSWILASLPALISISQARMWIRHRQDNRTRRERLAELREWLGRQTSIEWETVLAPGAASTVQLTRA
jgi:hypothetical protein